MKPGDDLQPVFDEVSRERHAASGRAVKLVEMTADRQLIRFSKEAAELAKAEEKTVRRQVRARLLLMYGRKKDDGAFLDAVDAIMARHESTVANELLARAMTDLGEETGEWGSVLAYYRRCLADLETSYGLPGDWFAESSGHVVDPADQRRLGQLPPMDN